MAGNVLKPGERKFNPKEMPKIMEALDKHKKHAIPLADIERIEIGLPKSGFFALRTKKGYITIHTRSGQSIKLIGDYYFPDNNAIELFNELFPSKVIAFKQ